MATSPIPAGSRAYRRASVEVPGPPVPDTQGSYRESWTASGPQWWIAIEPASLDSERLGSGVVSVQAVYTIVGPYRADVTVAARLVLDDGAILDIASAESPGGRKLELILRCVEVDKAASS